MDKVKLVKGIALFLRTTKFLKTGMLAKVE